MWKGVLSWDVIPADVRLSARGRQNRWYSWIAEREIMIISAYRTGRAPGNLLLICSNRDYSQEDYHFLPQEKNLRYEVLRRFAKTAREKGYTAAFFAADLYANEAVSVFFSKNLWVPEDISVVGFDDNVYARLSRPTLTTVRQSPTDKGREAVKLLLKRIYGQKVMVRSMELPTELIVRESVRNIWKRQNVV